MWLRRLVLPACLLCWAAGAGAANLLYGSLLEVQGISRKDSRLQMPLSRKKYADVRLLDRSLYQFLLSCGEECSFNAPGKEVEIVSFREAKTRPNMWIAQAGINKQLLITFLIFKRADAFNIIAPQAVAFKDQPFFEEIKTALLRQVQAKL